jgi:hypothetical protein
MAKRLSEQLSDLAARAKDAEDAWTAAQKEAHDEIAARREQAHASATAAIEKVNQQIKSIGDTATENWNVVQAKISADIDALKANVAQRKRERDRRRAENRAEMLETEADFAVDYAIASVEQAKLAVLDAVVSRMEAEEEA